METNIGMDLRDSSIAIVRKKLDHSTLTLAGVLCLSEYALLKLCRQL